MSRVGKKPIVLPSKVKLSRAGSQVVVEGPRGKLSCELSPSVVFEDKEGHIFLTSVGEGENLSALYGTARALIANMVQGVSVGFQKVLDINGVGYRAEVKGKALDLTLGYSHPVQVEIPDGIKVTVDKQTAITLEANDREALGQFAANIRKLRPPEPYKGKGIKYRDEVIERKVGKSASK